MVFDPVMVATSGHRLIEEETINAITEKLFPIADVITPNMDEAAILAEMKVETLEDLYTAGKKIKNLGCKTILLKGGHQEASTITSLFYDENEVFHSFETLKFNTNNTHGSGCTLSSAIAAYIARGKTLYDAVSSGQEYTYQAIENGTDVQTGLGNGPLNHVF